MLPSAIGSNTNLCNLLELHKTLADSRSQWVFTNVIVMIAVV